ncbi:hypothetical protein CCMA1212_007912 [Trichoderma ghanense]|uniref:Uncharacterized protein n=1 Tax=Trichoderma ghanense TaxID=65468 RepID=A0ABY2GYY6_9HYPO
MEQETVEQNIGAKVHFWYGLNREPVGSLDEAIHDNIPMVLILREGDAESRATSDKYHVFELAASGYEGHLWKYRGRIYHCTGAQLEGLIKDAQEQTSTGDGVFDDKACGVIEERLSNWQKDPSKAPPFEKILVRAMGAYDVGDGSESDKTVTAGHEGGTDQRMKGVRKVGESSQVGGDAVDTNSPLDGDKLCSLAAWVWYIDTQKVDEKEVVKKEEVQEEEGNNAGSLPA